jgi:hypothetical protein
MSLIWQFIAANKTFEELGATWSEYGTMHGIFS